MKVLLYLYIERTNPKVGPQKVGALLWSLISLVETHKQVSPPHTVTQELVGSPQKLVAHLRIGVYTAKRYTADEVSAVCPWSNILETRTRWWRSLWRRPEVPTIKQRITSVPVGTRQKIQSFVGGLWPISTKQNNLEMTVGLLYIFTIFHCLCLFSWWCHFGFFTSNNFGPKEAQRQQRTLLYFSTKE